jgi:hypothetical protein
MGMRCDCEILPVYTYFDPQRGISQRLRPFNEPVTASNWRELFRCEICGTFWRIDIEDKYQQRFVWKVGEYRDDWATVNLIDEEKELLLQRRGGNTNEACIWAGCEKMKVKSQVGMNRCIECATYPNSNFSLFRIFLLQLLISQRIGFGASRESRCRGLPWNE